MRQIEIFLVIGFTVVWYFTSSKNAIATQKVVEDHLRSQGSNEKMQFMVVLTTLQLMSGLCICYFLQSLLLIMKNQSVTTEDRQDKSTKAQSTHLKNSGYFVFIGLLHFVGSFFTNMGFAYGSASLVQVVKLLEPIETLILTASVNSCILGRPHRIEVKKTISVLVIVTGTSMLLAQKAMKPNPLSVTFAIFSGFSMASRNVISKISKAKSKSDTVIKDNKEIVGCIGLTTMGVAKFSRITTAAFLPAIFLLFLFEINNVYQHGANASRIKLIWSSETGSEAILYHALYNIFSISVLSLVSAQSHSLLNVGKRISNVIIAAFVFQVPLGVGGIIGLLVAAIGGFVYSTKDWNKWRCINCRRWRTFLMCFGFTVIALGLCSYSISIATIANKFRHVANVTDIH